MWGKKIELKEQLLLSLCDCFEGEPLPLCDYSTVPTYTQLRRYLLYLPETTPRGRSRGGAETLRERGNRRREGCMSPVLGFLRSLGPRSSNPKTRGNYS